MTSFADLIPQAKQFYQALDANNTRDWWQANRAPYDEVLKPAATALLSAVTPALETLSGTPIKTKLYRPHRDVRFSKDKRPYNTHLHMMWQMQDDDAAQNPVYFFGIGLDYVTAGVGLMQFEKPVLDTWRKLLDLDTDNMMSVVEGVENSGFSLREPALKRVPAPYDKDHRAGRLLRCKGVVASKELAESPDLVAALETAFAAGHPLNEMLCGVARA